MHALNLDWVSLWKALSIVLTGAFGVLGLTTEYRDKTTDRITKWGRIALIGILVSTIGGVLAQIKETTDDATRALVLAKKTDTEVTNIQRLLTMIGTPDFRVSMILDCRHAGRFTTPCLQLENENISDEQVMMASLGRTIRVPGNFSAGIYFYKNDHWPDRYEASPVFNDADLQFPFDTTHATLSRTGTLREVELAASDSEAAIRNTGKIMSYLDLKNTTMQIALEGDFVATKIVSMKPEAVFIELANGETFSIDADKLQKARQEEPRKDIVVYYYTFSSDLQPL